MKTGIVISIHQHSAGWNWKDYLLSLFLNIGPGKIYLTKNTNLSIGLLEYQLQFNFMGKLMDILASTTGTKPFDPYI